MNKNNILQCKNRHEFRQFPPLYQRIRAYNVAFYKQRDRLMYEQTLQHLIEEAQKGKMFGEWNDYGRLFVQKRKNVKKSPNSV